MKLGRKKPLSAPDFGVKEPNGLRSGTMSAYVRSSHSEIEDSELRRPLVDLMAPSHFSAGQQ
jgi:hypothetical protein